MASGRPDLTRTNGLRAYSALAPRRRLADGHFRRRPCLGDEDKSLAPSHQERRPDPPRRPAEITPSRAVYRQPWVRLPGPPTADKCTLQYSCCRAECTPQLRPPPLTHDLPGRFPFSRVVVRPFLVVHLPATNLTLHRAFLVP